jgi:hypothetical protein
VKKEENKHVKGKTQTCTVSLNLHNHLRRELLSQMRKLRLQNSETKEHSCWDFKSTSIPAKLVKASNQRFLKNGKTYSVR